jgi:hypothetical protein
VQTENDYLLMSIMTCLAFATKHSPFIRSLFSPQDAIRARNDADRVKKKLRALERENAAKQPPVNAIDAVAAKRRECIVDHIRKKKAQRPVLEHYDWVCRTMTEGKFEKKVFGPLFTEIFCDDKQQAAAVDQVG